MALAGALVSTLSAVTGITNKSLRALMTGLLGTAYSVNQASYDLARLSRTASSPASRTATCMPSPPTACASRSSTAKSTTASCARSWPATSPRPRPRSATHWASSTTKSPGASPQHDSRQQPDQPDARLIPRYPAGKLKTNVKVLVSKLR
jgi:hypothetical protein